MLTTNIDNLFEKIFEKFNNQFLNDTFLDGKLESKDIDLFKLHGSVTYSYEVPMLFSIDELTGAFLRDNSFWTAAQIKHFSFPSLFWGINIDDPNIVDLINKDNFGKRPCGHNWILILPDTKYDLDAETYADDGYFIIRGNTRSLLDYFQYNMNTKNKETFLDSGIKSDEAKYFYAYSLESILKQKHPARPVKLFYEGDNPRWSDIIENQLFKLTFFNTALNDILKYKHVHITGLSGSGKTTLLMQLAASKEILGTKYFFDTLTVNQAKKFISEIDKKNIVYIFIDNLSSNLDAFDILKTINNYRIISAERDTITYTINGINNLASDTSIIDISNITQSEVNNICNFMHKSEYKYKNEQVSLFEIVFKLWFNYSAKERIQQIIEKLPDDLLEFYTIITYARYAGISCSFEMLLAYYYNECDYKQIYKYAKNLRSLVDDENYYDDDDSQDYFSLRSKIFSEMSITIIDPNVLSKVIRRFHNNINQRLIPNFKMFKRKAWDADIMCIAFQDWREGKNFYDEQILKNNDFFIKHQYAIYLYRKNMVDDAWRLIEEAYNDSNGRVFSIRNTHATYLFDRNIDKKEDSHDTVINSLLSSFDELEKCLNNDNSKTYHVTTYARHALKFYHRYKNADSRFIINKAITYIDRELKNNDFKPFKLIRALQDQRTQLLRME
nr:SIR2 family protein [Seleniivibrio woodruffii]